jgi:small subunit ribosomal protein S19
MTRSSWKLNYIDPLLLKQLYVLSKMKSDKKPVLQIWSRQSTILPDFVGLKVMVHNGIRFVTITLTKAMVGHKFGEFALTKRMGSLIHSPNSQKGILKKRKKK